MEEAFNDLIKRNKNNLEGIKEWFKEAKLIDGKVIKEADIKKLFEDCKGEITMEKFKEKLAQLVKDCKISADLIEAKLCDTAKVMDDAFEKLKKDGKNNVDNIVQWMKDSKIIDTAKDSEEKARKLLAEVKDKTDKIDLDKFKDTVNKMVEEKSNKIADIAKAAKSGATGMMNAFGAATSALKDSLNK